jgi:esterase/lipase superfamily enzyme
MNREYHRWFAHQLGRDMELLCFGHAGVPVLVFPTSQGRFYEYEDRGMIGVLWDRIEHGAVQFYCVDSVDAESWYNRGAHPYWRVQRHIQYERYILEDVLPLIRQKNPTPRLGVTGCSFGAYHALNFALRHPNVVTHCVTMGGAFNIKQFLDGFYNDDCYFNNPPDYLPNLSDPWYLDRYRSMTFILATGEHDKCWNDNEQMAAMMRGKGIPHRLDVWGEQTGHDWPWWLKMARVYFS